MVGTPYSLDRHYERFDRTCFALSKRLSNPDLAKSFAFFACSYAAGASIHELPRRSILGNRGYLLLPTCIGSGETVHNVLVLLTRLRPSRKILFPSLSNRVHSAGRSTL